MFGGQRTGFSWLVAEQLRGSRWKSKHWLLLGASDGVLLSRCNLARRKAVSSRFVVFWNSADNGLGNRAGVKFEKPFDVREDQGGLGVNESGIGKQIAVVLFCVLSVNQRKGRLQKYTKFQCASIARAWARASPRIESDCCTHCCIHRRVTSPLEPSKFLHCISAQTRAYATMDGTYMTRWIQDETTN